MKTSDDGYPQTSPQNSPQKLNDDIISFLQRLREKGVKSVYLSEAPASAQGAAVTQTPAETSTTEDTSMPQASTMGSAPLAELEKVVSTCTLCGLHEGRTKTVFGTGDP